jgi:hypothetical protein
VREYLTARALANLAGPSAVETSQTGQDRTGFSTTADQPDLDQIHVTGANFVQVVVHATVSAKDRQKSDSTRQDILKQLAAFLDPVDGGPDRQGWEPGREVYLSEIKAEIENVPGVDHVGEVWLETPSRQQQCLFPEPETALAVPMPAGSQVSTFDERIKGLLLARLPAGPAPDTIVAGGFSDDDSVVVGRLQDPGPFVRRITLARPGPGEPATSPRIANRVVFDTPIDFGDRSAFDAWRLAEPRPAVATEDGSVAAPIEDAVDAFDFQEDASGRVHLLSVRVTGFAKNEPISLVDHTRRGRRVDFIPIRDVSADQKLARVFVPRDHLVCSGNHEIVMAI